MLSRSDRILLTNLIATHVFPQGQLVFEMGKFENYFGIKPLRDRGMSFNKFIKYHPDLRAIGKTPYGQNFWFQVNSLLPEKPLFAKADVNEFQNFWEKQRSDPYWFENNHHQVRNEDLFVELSSRQALAYVIARRMTKGLHRKYQPALAVKATDAFANALLFLYKVSEVTKQPINWIQCIEGNIDNIPRTFVPSLTLQPDTLVSTKAQQRIVKRIWSEMNIIQNHKVSAIATQLLHENDARALTFRRFGTILKMNRNAAREIPREMFVRRIIFSPAALGIRLRFLLLPKRAETHNIASHATKYVLAESLHKEVHVHLEPQASEGPEGLPEGTVQFSVDKEIVSIRYDLFDKEEGVWNVRPWQPLPREPTNASCREGGCELSTKPRGRFTPREFSFISRVAYHLATPENQQKLLFWVDPKMTSASLSQTVAKLHEDKAIEFLYHPRLELIDLPEAILVTIAKARNKDIEWGVNWLMDVFPFAQIFTSSQEDSLAAFLRTPKFRSVLLRSALRDVFEKRGVNCEVSLIAGERSRYLTLPKRLYRFISNQEDPWR